MKCVSRDPDGKPCSREMKVHKSEYVNGRDTYTFLCPWCHSVRVVTK